MRREEIILQIENDILLTEKEISRVRAEMPMPTLSMKSKRIEKINEAWTKIETLNKRLELLHDNLKRENAASKIEQSEIAVWKTATGKWQCQVSDSYKRYSIVEADGKYISNCPHQELSVRFIEAIINNNADGGSIEQHPKTPYTNYTPRRGATILPGQRFHAPSDKKPAIWEVYERIKNEKENIIRCKVIDGAPQDRTYIGQQFGYLIRQGIIRLISREESVA